MRQTDRQTDSHKSSPHYLFGYANQDIAEEARARIACLIKGAKIPKRNVSEEEWKAISSLRKDKDGVIIEVDKGNATVVMDSIDYDKKAMELIGKHPFKQLARDPTSKNEKRVNDLLKRLEKDGAIDKKLLSALRLPVGSSQPPLFYGRVKLHKQDYPDSLSGRFLYA